MMIMLVAARHPLIARNVHPHLGRLITPRLVDRVELTAAAGIPWAADNDAFKGFDEWAYRNMLDEIRGLPGCLFVAAPDVVADAPATLERFARWRPVLDGFPVALVAQDGMRPDQVPWDEIAALFLGGTDAFKLGPAGELLATAALEHGKWLHAGRVNSYRRMRYCATIGVESIDGFQWTAFDKLYLRNGLGAAGQPRQPRLEEGR